MDTQLWDRVLESATVSPELHTALLELKTKQAALVREGSVIKLRPGELPADEYNELRNRLLVPHAVQLRALLASVGEAAPESKRTILLADNGHLRVEVTYDDAARGTDADKLEQFKAAIETLRILQSLHYGPTEETDENGNKTTWPPLPERIKNGEAYVTQQKRVMGPDRERRVAEENCNAAEARLAELRAKVDSWQAREDAEYERIEALERELAGPGCLLCWQCGSAFRIGEGCECWRSGDVESI